MHGQSAAARAPKIRRYIFTVFAAAVRRAMTPLSGARGSFYNRQLTSGPPTARPALFTILLSLPLHASPDGSADRQASFHFFALFVFAETYKVNTF